jgi:hypothetical protein
VSLDHTAPAGREGRYAVGLGTLASLVAGRASYRSVLLVTTVLLLVVWGEERYGVYAAAMGSLSWLMVLVLTGPEKTMLKLRPRVPRIGAALNDALVAVVWWSPLPLAAAFVVVLWWRGSGDPAPVYLGVATMQFSIGCTILLVGLHRAAGRPRTDSVTFLVMSAVQLLLLGAAVAGGLGPVGYVASIVAVQLCVNLALSASLGHPSLRIRHRPRLLRRLGVTVLLLSGSDLFVYLTTAVLFTILAASRHSGQVARLYAVMVVWSAAVALLIYLLRVYTPRTSLRLTGRAGRAGRTRVARLARWLVAADVVWLGALAGTLAVTDLAGLTSPTGRMLLWAGLLASRAPLLATLLWLTFRLENTDATAPRVVALAAAMGLAGAALAGLVAVHTLGGVGMIAAGAAGELAYALVLATRGDPRPALAPARPATAPRFHTGAELPSGRA